MASFKYGLKFLRPHINLLLWGVFFFLSPVHQFDMMPLGLSINLSLLSFLCLSKPCIFLMTWEQPVSVFLHSVKPELKYWSTWKDCYVNSSGSVKYNLFYVLRSWFCCHNIKNPIHLCILCLQELSCVRNVYPARRGEVHLRSALIRLSLSK